MTSKNQPQAGDILIVSPFRRTYYKKDRPVRHFIEKRIYKPLSTKIQGQFVHAGIFTGKDRVVEGLGKGFVTSSFAKATRGKDYIIVRPNRPKKQRKAAARFAEEQLGKPYSLAHLFGASMSTAQPAPVRRLISRVLGSKKKEREAYQCAGMVAAAYASTGRALDPSTHPIVTAPVHLIANTESKIIKMKLRRGQSLQSPAFPTTRRKFQDKIKSAAWNIARINNRIDIQDNTYRREIMKAASPDMESLIHSFFQEELTKIAAHCTPAHRAALPKKKKAVKGKVKQAGIKDLIARLGRRPKVTVKQLKTGGGTKVPTHRGRAKHDRFTGKARRVNLHSPEVNFRTTPGPVRASSSLDLRPSVRRNVTERSTPSEVRHRGMDKESAMRAPSAATRNLLLGGALGLGAGLPAGAYAGYKREQNRLSPQEQAVVRQAMQQAYRQGNIAMYNRLRAMAQKPKKNTK